MSDWAPKRFWQETSVVDAEDGFEVRLDTRPVRTPAKQPLVLPSRALADAVAEEWQAQEERIDPRRMPVTRSANAAIDKVRPQQAEVAAMLSAYGDSDLLCYRAEGPAELVARQEAGWDPMLDWAAATFEARLEPRTGVMHAPQDPDALAKLAAAVARLDAFELAAFHDLVSLTGSLVLGLAAERGQDAETIWRLSRIDEEWQAELWGADDEATRVAEEKRTDFNHAVRFLTLLRA
ncbi:ATP12 family chaperone protein [Litorisediminicola beolgyonensis]|uniref:ATP12 family chaperone protein n=1 Tax=Litorisediminicola beolgyonensis TaxID=1173614 RepID=A0ABW3ZCY2_9RHOB